MQGLNGPGKVCLMTSFVGFGDLLYMTPLIRFLKKSLGLTVDVWSVNSEPFLNNKDINDLYTFNKKAIPKPLDFYKRVFNFCRWGENISISNIHPTDLFTQEALNISLRNKEKDLVFDWHPNDEKKVQDLLRQHSLKPVSTGLKSCNYVIMSPIITWPSRTYPLEFYQRLCTRIQRTGDKVLLVGKDVTHQGVKSLYSADNFPGAIDFTNKLSLAEAGALYSMSKLAYSSESANMLLACTNDTCWNVFLTSLSAPEFRLPWRNGRQHYLNYVVANDDDYYPTTDYRQLSKFDNAKNVPVKYATPEQAYSAYWNILNTFD